MQHMYAFFCTLLSGFLTFMVTEDFTLSVMAALVALTGIFSITETIKAPTQEQEKPEAAPTGKTHTA